MYMIPGSNYNQYIPGTFLVPGTTNRVFLQLKKGSPVKNKVAAEAATRAPTSRIREMCELAQTPLAV